MPARNRVVSFLYSSPTLALSLHLVCTGLATEIPWSNWAWKLRGEPIRTFPPDSRVLFITLSEMPWGLGSEAALLSSPLMRVGWEHTFQLPLLELFMVSLSLKSDCFRKAKNLLSLWPCWLLLGIGVGGFSAQHPRNTSYLVCLLTWQNSLLVACLILHLSQEGRYIKCEVGWRGRGGTWFGTEGRLRECLI